MTEDFLKYLHDKQVGSEGGPEGKESHDPREASHDHEDDAAERGYDEEAYLSAENVVRSLEPCTKLFQLLVGLH